MSLKASTRQVGAVTIVDLSGQIKLGEGSSVLRDTVKDLLGKGQKKILVNLGDVNYIDSAGIGELVMFCQGSSARLAPNLKDAPVDAVIIGIVDTVDVMGKQIYSAKQ